MLEFRLLGSLEVRCDGETLPLRARKPRQVLAALLIRRNQVVPADSLIDMLWADAPPAQAANALQVYVSQLRRLLGADRIVTRPTGYRLHVNAGEIDVEKFEALAEAGAVGLRAGQYAGAAAALDQALALWRGPALGELADDDFARPAAQRLEELRLGTEEDRLDAALALGRHDAVIAELEELIHRQPLRERPRAQLMTALFRAGRQPEALRAYQDFRRLLGEELGLEPSRELVDLERAIAAGEPDLHWAGDDSPPAPPPRGNVPPPRASLVGREVAVAELREMLAAERFVTLVGPGGVGKTALALEVAAALSAACDSAWFVDLASATAGSVTSAIAASLDVSDTGSDAAAAVGAALGTTRALLVVDNCDRVAEEAGVVVADLLQRCPGVTVLATSRTATGAGSEVAWPVTLLGVPDTDAADAAATSPAVQLFIERANESDATFNAGGDDLAAVIAICRRLDGLPLAIELAAALVRFTTTAELADRLQQSVAALASRDAGRDPRHRSLRSMVDWTTETLAPEHRRTLAELSVFAGGFTLAAAQAVASADDVLDGLIDLTDRALLVVGRANGAPRYRMLEPIRELAGEALDAEAATALAARHAAFFAALAASLTGARAAEPGDRVGALRADEANLRAAFDHLISRPDSTDDALALAADLWWFWDRTGRWREGREVLETALAAAAVDAPARARASVGAGWLARNLSMWEAAEARLGDAVAAARAAGDDVALCDALNYLGSVATHLGRASDAHAFLEEAVTVADRAGYTAGSMMVRVHLGNLLYNGGDLAGAEENFRAGLAIARANGWHGSASGMLTNLAMIVEDRGDAPGSLALEEEALVLARQAGDEAGVAILLANLTQSYSLLGRDDEARASAAEAIDRFRAMGDTLGEARTISMLAAVSRREGNLTEARALSESCLPLQQAAGDELGECLTLLSIGQVAWLQGDTAYAREMFARGEELARRRNFAACLAAVLSDSAAMEFEAGAVADDVRPRLVEALELARTVGPAGAVTLTEERLADVDQALASRH